MPHSNPETAAALPSTSVPLITPLVVVKAVGELVVTLIVASQLSTEPTVKGPPSAASSAASSLACMSLGSSMIACGGMPAAISTS